MTLIENKKQTRCFCKLKCITKLKFSEMQNENIVKELRQYMKVKADEAIMSKLNHIKKYL